METNLVPNYDLHVFDISADDFGDPTTVGDGHIIKALVENNDGFDIAEWNDQHTGAITCQFMPTEPFYLEKKGELYGLLAQFTRLGDAVGSDDWYRITGIHAGESLVDGSPDLVEMTLARIAAPQESEG